MLSRQWCLGSSTDGWIWIEICRVRYPNRCYIFKLNAFKGQIVLFGKAWKKARAIQKSVFEVWQESVVKTLDSFVERKRLSGEALGYNNEISALLSIPQEVHDPNLQQHDDMFDYYDVVLVHWTHVATREGRVIRLDPHNRVIYSAPYLFGKQNPSLVFDESKFCNLATSIGAQNRKQRGNLGNLREAVSDSMSHFLTFSKFACNIANNAAWQ